MRVVLACVVLLLAAAPAQAQLSGWKGTVDRHEDYVAGGENGNHFVTDTHLELDGNADTVGCGDECSYTHQTATWVRHETVDGTELCHPQGGEPYSYRFHRVSDGAGTVDIGFTILSDASS